MSMNNYQNATRHTLPITAAYLQNNNTTTTSITTTTATTITTTTATGTIKSLDVTALSTAVNQHNININQTSQQQIHNIAGHTSMLPPLPTVPPPAATNISCALSSTFSTQPLISNSLAIRQEIQRFESVHPSIYAIYDLIDLLPATDAQIAQQIRDHVVCIEDSFVNSQEWTISRAVPDVRLGIVGSLHSGKSALVHRYLTGSYMQEESPEGGRFKKEVFIDGLSYLLLVRDEGGAPEMQFAAWVDAVIFVFSLENEASFNTVYNYYTKLAHFRNGHDLPIILVGTQDAINENNPRVIDDARARKLANDLKRCAYYETCATYGLNVERVFQDACQKILQQRAQLTQALPSRPTTPQGTRLSISSFNYNANNRNSSSSSSNSNVVTATNGVNNVSMPPPYRQQVHSTSSLYARNNDFAYNEQQQLSNQNHNQKMWAQPQMKREQQQRRDLYPIINNENNNISKYKMIDEKQLLPPPAQILHAQKQQQQHQQQHMDTFSLVPLREAKENSFSCVGSTSSQKDLPTPTSTPTTSRKSRRRSNLFIPSSSKKSEKEAKNNELGSGRSIPIKQGYLYKRSSKSLNKEWKKKYVTLCADGRLTYHPSLHDYMDDVHGKEIPLQYVTVKVPGQKPRGSKSIITNSVLTSSLFSNAFESLRDPVKSNSSQQTSGDDEGIALSNSNSQTFITNAVDNQQQQQQQQQLNIKKRHRRVKSSGVKANEMDDSDGYEFFIVSLDAKQWHFEAANSEERDEWVAAIEQEIFKSLQGIESSKMKPATTSELAAMVAIRTRVPGNTYCVDCDAPNPEWASLNLGVLLCIECSGIHRNLGSHISKVRSLDLDDWPPGHLSVMLAIGNKLANSVWEANKGTRIKPQALTNRDEKEAWARSKYEAKEFMVLHQNGNFNSTATGQHLIEAVIKADMKSIISILANANTEVINATVSARDVRTPLLLSCAMGNLAIVQLLIWNGANIKHMDHEGRTCLSYARAAHSLATAKSLRATEASSGNSSNASSTNSSTSSAATANSNAQYSVEETTALVELLIALGCPETAPLTASGTLPRRRDTLGTAYEKLMSGII